jgi:hypothetical protein
MTDTSDAGALEALDARVTAEPDADSRARLLDVDLAELGRIRGRLLRGYWTIALGLLVVLGVPLIVNVASALGDTGGFLGGLLLQYMLGGVSLWVVLVVSTLLVGAIVAQLQVRPDRVVYAMGIGSSLGTLAALFVLVAARPHQFGFVVGAVAFAGVAHLLTFRTGDLAGAIRANLPGVTAAVLSTRGVRDSLAGRIRWYLVQFTATALGIVGCLMLITAAWWAVFPIALTSCLVTVVAELVFRHRGFPRAVMVQLGYNGALFVAGVVFAGRMLLPVVTFVPSLPGLPV